MSNSTRPASRSLPEKKQQSSKPTQKTRSRLLKMIIKNESKRHADMASTGKR